MVRVNVVVRASTAASAKLMTRLRLPSARDRRLFVVDKVRWLRGRGTRNGKRAYRVRGHFKKERRRRR